MMLTQVLSKEWLKLRQLSAVLFTLVVVAGGYFTVDLVGQFANIEPESMMWYRYSHLGDKPYWWVKYSFLLVAASIALCQFIPEIMGKRIRILMHLPLSTEWVVYTHTLVGGSLIIAVNSLLAVIVLLAMNYYYPSVITIASAKDMLFSQLPALAMYLGLVMVLVENEWRRRALKITLAIALVILAQKNHYQWQDLVWLSVLIWFILPLKDSFLSIKTRRIEGRGYRMSFAAILLIMVSSIGLRLHDQYAVTTSKYYLFYSHLLKDYVYQENAPHHRFNYGTASLSFDKSEFENALPFVFWKNFDIQGKLPVEVDGRFYDKMAIRRSRLSLQYNSERISSPDVPLYPLFNPISNKGSIRFPENAFVPLTNSFAVYAAETAKLNHSLTNEINQLAEQLKVQFPIRNVWGKTTNMKPFDWGYFIQDTNGTLFNLRRADGVLSLVQVPDLETSESLVYLQVSENRQKSFYGYAISQSSDVYLIGYPDYQWVKLDLNDFDYRTMSFQLLADPLNYLLRYDDGKQYHAVRFDKQYRRLDQAVFE